MRQIDKPEDQSALPPPIRKPADPPTLKKTGREGVLIDADGKRQTNIETPPKPTIWDLYGIPGPKP